MNYSVERIDDDDVYSKFYKNPNHGTYFAVNYSNAALRTGIIPMIQDMYMDKCNPIILGTDVFDDAEVKDLNIKFEAKCFAEFDFNINYGKVKHTDDIPKLIPDYFSDQTPMIFYNTVAKVNDSAIKVTRILLNLIPHNQITFDNYINPQKINDIPERGNLKILLHSPDGRKILCRFIIEIEKSKRVNSHVWNIKKFEIV